MSTFSESKLENYSDAPDTDVEVDIMAIIQLLLYTSGEGVQQKSAERFVFKSNVDFLITTSVLRIMTEATSASPKEIDFQEKAVERKFSNLAEKAFCSPDEEKSSRLADTIPMHIVLKIKRGSFRFSFRFEAPAVS